MARWCISVVVEQEVSIGRGFRYLEWIFLDSSFVGFCVFFRSRMEFGQEGVCSCGGRNGEVFRMVMSRFSLNVVSIWFFK